MVNELQRRNKIYDNPLVCGHYARKKYINAKCRYSGRPSKHSLQNASAVQLGVSQHIFVADLMCRPAHGRPVLPFVSSANNCRSEHIPKMLLSNLSIATE
jgi:hypothetical protein